MASAYPGPQYVSNVHLKIVPSGSGSQIGTRWSYGANTSICVRNSFHRLTAFFCSLESHVGNGSPSESSAALPQEILILDRDDVVQGDDAPILTASYSCPNGLNYLTSTKCSRTSLARVANTAPNWLFFGSTISIGKAGARRHL